MVFNGAFNNISAISCRSVLLVEETGVHLYFEKTIEVASHWQTLSHNVVHIVLMEIRTHKTSMVIGTDCIGNYKSNYHTITATTAPTSIITLCFLKDKLLTVFKELCDRTSTFMLDNIYWYRFKYSCCGDIKMCFCLVISIWSRSREKPHCSINY